MRDFLGRHVVLPTTNPATAAVAAGDGADVDAGNDEFGRRVVVQGSAAWT
jgi:hypothetical protein